MQVSEPLSRANVAKLYREATRGDKDGSYQFLRRLRKAARRGSGEVRYATDYGAMLHQDLIPDDAGVYDETGAFTSTEWTLGYYDPETGGFLAHTDLSAVLGKAGLGEADTFFQPAYHGSAVKQLEGGRFSLQKIGTGEGAQVYGSGLYFAERRGIAEHYRSTVSAQKGQRAPRVSVDGVPVEGLDSSAVGRQNFYLDRFNDRAIAASLGHYASERQQIILESHKADDDAVRAEVVASYVDRVSRRQMEPAAAVAQLRPLFARELETAQNRLVEIEEDLGDTLEANGDPREPDLALLSSHVLDRLLRARGMVDWVRALLAEFDALTPNIAARVQIEQPGQLFEVELPENVDLLNYDAPLMDVENADQIAKLAALGTTLRERGEAGRTGDPGTRRDADRAERLIALGQPLERLPAVIPAIQRDSAAAAALGDIHARLIAEKRSFAGVPELDAALAESAAAHAAYLTAVGQHTNLAYWDGQKLYNQLGYALGGEKQASAALRAAGIPGLFYRDEPSRRIKPGESPTHNFVIWDEAAIRVMRTFYQAPRQGGLFAGAGEITPEAKRMLEHLKTASDRTVSAIGAALELADPNAIADELAAEGLATLTASDQTADPLGRQVAITKAGRERLGLDRPVYDEQGSLFSPGNRGAITFSPDQREAIVRFTAAADLSTALHEIGHYYTLTLLREADALREQEPSAAWETQVLADADALLKAVGAEPGDTVTREQAEQMTDFFLAYLRTGKAPSEALRSAFGRFRDWLVLLYRSVRDLIGKDALPDDVRAVFDRLLATDEEIARQEGDAALGSIFAPGEVTPEEQAVLEAAMAKARERVTNQVDRAQLLAMAKQRGIFERVEAERDRKEAEIRESITAEVARDMAREPVWQADHYLRTGQLLGRETPEGLPAYKISRKALYSLFREDTPAGQAIAAVPTGQRSWLTASKDGVHPDTLAEQFGYASGADLVRALLAAGSRESGSRERVAKAEVQRRLNAAGKLAAGELEERVLAALAGDSMADWLEVQDKILHAQIGDGPTPLQALRHQAERMLSETKVGDVLANRAAHDRSTLHRATAEREQRAARKAYKAGDRERAALHLQRVQLHRLLERLSYGAKDELRAMLDYARRWRSSVEVRKRIGLSGDGRLDQGDAILERVTLKAESDPEIRRRRAPFIEWVRARMADGDQLAVPDLPGNAEDPLYAEMPRWMKEGMRQNYREMTLGEFRGMIATLKSIDHAARRELEVRIGEETRQRSDVRASLIAEVESVLRPATRLSSFNLVPFEWGNIPEALERRDAARLGDRLFAWGREAAAYGTGPEALIWAIAHADPTTTIYQLFIGKLSESEAKAGDMLRALAEPMRNIHARYLTRRGREYLSEHLPENRLRNRFKDGAPFELTRRHLLHLAYNLGNIGPGSNLTKLVGGYGWISGEMADLDPEGTRAWLVGILDEHLDAEDWAHVQAVWDLTDSFREPVFDLEERMTGTRPEAIEAAPFTTPRTGVAMRGGYFPVVFDPSRSSAAALRSAEEILKTQALGVGRVEPKHPWTKGRTGLKSRALLIEGDVILFGHLEGVIRDLAFREALLDIWKTINHDDVQDAFRRALGEEFGVVEWWKPWLQSIAGERRVPDLSAWQGLMFDARGKAAAFTLLGRITTILKQVTGLGNAVQQLSTQVTDEMLPAGITAHVGLRHAIAARALVRGAWRSLGGGNWREAIAVRQLAMGTFPVLRGRMESYDREIKEARARVAGETGAKAWLVEALSKAIAWVQLHVVDIPLAFAAYDLARARGLDVQAAIASGESAVRVGQGSGSRLSQPLMLRAFDALLSNVGFLGTYRLMTVNQVAMAWKTTHSPGAFLGAVIFSAMLPQLAGRAIMLLYWTALAAAGLKALVPGEEPPDDEDWWSVPVAGLEGVADMVPFVSEAYRMVKHGRFEPFGWVDVWGETFVDLGVSIGDLASDASVNTGIDALIAAARAAALSAGLPGGYLGESAEKLFDDSIEEETRGGRRGSSRAGGGR